MKNSSTSNQNIAYEYVRNQILTLGLKPGECITDTQIANLLNISRTPVREAFFLLEKEGLLVNEARRGWKVYTLTLGNINDIFDLKETIEGMIARKAAACQDENLRSELKNALLRMEKATAAGDPNEWLQADIYLHDVLFTMAGNERAREIIENLNAQWHRVRIGFVALKSRTRRSIDEHRAFVDSILAGNGELAEQQMQAHLHQVRDELVHLLVSVVLPFVDDGV